MNRETPPGRQPASAYVLDIQIGFLLRKAYQRNSTIFQERVPGKLTTTQFSVLQRLSEVGPVSQNQLGRSVAMDSATTKGVVDRLIMRGLLASGRDPQDRRRHLVSLTEEGKVLISEAVAAAAAVSAETLEPLRDREKETLLRLLARIT